MPSILTEIGFLSNANEAAFMLSEAGQQSLASAIAAGFSSYYRSYRWQEHEDPGQQGG